MTAPLVTSSLPVLESFAPAGSFRPGTRCVGCGRPILADDYDDAGAYLVNGANVRPGCWLCPTCHGAA